MTHILLDHRHRTRKVRIGDVVIGGEELPVVQSMTNTDTRNAGATLEQIHHAAAAGARIMRVAVPDTEAVEALPSITEDSPVPVVADIHFDYRLAVGSITAGVAKLRINPGNIGGPERLRTVVHAAADHGVPIRVGVNAGSLEKGLLNKYGRPCAEALCESALNHAEQLEALGFSDIVLSLKGSDVPMTVAAYRRVAELCDYPLHIGVTEAGTRWTGAIRSSVGLGILLALGIGDTLRVSLAADPVDEVTAAYRILESLGMGRHGPTVIACPTCGRTEIDVIGLAEAVESRLRFRSEPFTVAVMGCAVNGPGEAAEADLGIAGGKGDALLFRKGRIVRKVDGSEILEALMDLYEEVAGDMPDALETGESGSE